MTGNLIRLVNIGLAGWLLGWALYVYQTRRAASDTLGGQWLAASWGCLLVAIVAGGIEANHRALPITVGAPIVTIGLVFGIVAQTSAVRSRNEPPQ